MFMLIWIILLRSYAEADQPELGLPACSIGFCVTLNEDVITAETGLCAVIHCSFSTPWDFYPSSLVWFKCEPGGSCTDSDIIFDSKNKNKIQSSFSGRVSLLEPDLSQRNCSIIINDLQLSDSGSYHFRVNRGKVGFGFSFSRATVSVKALQQKPTVQTPALTEGQHSALTCTAPGLCSGSEPTFTWTWRGAGDSPPNVTTATTDRLTPVNHRHRSTLELNASAELHGAELSCTVSSSSSSTRDSVRINVTYVKDLEVSGDTVVKEGDSLNVTCSVDSFPPSRLMWFGPNRTRLNVSETTERSRQTDHKRGLEVTKRNETHSYKTDPGSASLVIMNVTPENAGTYECTVQHELKNQTTHADVSVIYLREPVITGETTVDEGSALSLNCSVDSFPPSNITLRGGAGTYRNSGSVSLFISNVTLEDAGRYECTVEHELRTLCTSVDVLLKPRILSSSGCVYDGDVLSCSCISRASPVPAVTWPLLQHRSEYTLVTTVTGDTVHSSLVLRASGHNRTGVQCVSSNRAGQVQERFTPSITDPERTDPPVTVSLLSVIIVSLILNVVFIVVIVFLVLRLRTKKNPNQEEAYMSLQKRETSSEYEVIARPNS